MTTLDPSMHSGPLPAAPSRDRATIPDPRDRAMIAHDLRGALQGVLGGVAMLDAATVAPEMRDQLDRVAAAAMTLAFLLDGLIGPDLATDGRASHSRVDLPRFLRHLTRRWSGEARQRGVQLRVEPDPRLPAALHVDLVALMRALGNLVGNALGHGGSSDVRVVVRAAADGGVSFEVLDAGPGLPAAILERVLRPGRLGPAASGDGHGFGLHIARKLCAEMGGAFVLANRPGGGAAAGLVFPGALCEAAAPDAPAAPARLDLGGLRILLAEDNPTNQMVATQMLRALNAAVTLTSDGVEALERFETSEFDLVVVDIEMPRMTGLDVIRAIRSRTDGRADVPIVALTAYVLREHRERIAAAGANGLISKPITSVEALGQALRAHAPSGRRPPPALPPAAPASADEPVADLAIFDALCAAIGAGMMAELLEKVVADLMQARDDLAGALAPLDRGPIRSASHILISVAGAIGATRLQSCARSLNVAAHGEDGPSLPDDVRRCLCEIDAAVAFANSRRAAG